MSVGPRPPARSPRTRRAEAQVFVPSTTAKPALICPVHSVPTPRPRRTPSDASTSTRNPWCAPRTRRSPRRRSSDDAAPDPCPIRARLRPSRPSSSPSSSSSAAARAAARLIPSTIPALLNTGAWPASPASGSRGHRPCPRPAPRRGPMQPRRHSCALAGCALDAAPPEEPRESASRTGSGEELIARRDGRGDLRGTRGRGGVDLRECRAVAVVAAVAAAAGAASPPPKTLRARRPSPPRHD